ncbi:MAG: RNA polymerase sigma factor [Pirellulaceae bacterium]
MDTTERDWVTELTSDDQDVRQAAIGDLRTFLVRGLKSAFLKKGVDDAFCEDIAQDTTLRVLDQIDTFEGRSKLTTWAMTIGVRLAVNEFRRKRFQDVSLEGLSGDDALRIDVPAAQDAPESNMMRSAIMETLKSLIDNLSEKQRIAMQALLGGMPVDVIAEKTGSNRNAVYKLVHDARKSLKKGFDQAGYDWQDIHTALGMGQ